MNEYQCEQQRALSQTTAYIEKLSATDHKLLGEEIGAYKQFRERVDNFLSSNCHEICTLSCYTSKTSACCSKDGIITFWADVLINAYCSTPVQITTLIAHIQNPRYNHKCIYLGVDGCCWQVRPLVCTMFLCDTIHNEVLGKRVNVQAKWDALKSEAKSYRWPDQPVLFDDLEQRCINAGIQSPLMYLNNSPGLLKVKQQAGQGV